MSATTLIPCLTGAAEPTLNAVLTPAHDAWMADGDRLLSPVTDACATFLERWAAVHFVADQFRERFELEQALLEELQPFLRPKLKERLWLQVDRLARLRQDLERVAQQRGTAREVAHTAGELLEALRLWYAEIEFATGGIRQRDLSQEGSQLLGRLGGCAGPMVVASSLQSGIPA